MGKAGQKDNKGTGSGNPEDVVTLRSLAFLEKGVMTASELFGLVDATLYDTLKRNLTAREANVVLSGQRLKLSTVQTVHRIMGRAKVMKDGPIFDFSKTQALLEQKS